MMQDSFLSHLRISFMKKVYNSQTRQEELTKNGFWKGKVNKWYIQTSMKEYVYIYSIISI